MSETVASSAVSHLLVHFDAEKAEAYVPRGRNRGKRLGSVVHFVERPRKTPTGGNYISRQFTLTLFGTKWYGTCGKNMTPDGKYIVKCRPAK